MLVDGGTLSVDDKEKGGGRFDGIVQFLRGKAIFHIFVDGKTLIVMAQYPCENCKLRAYYDKAPKSFLGRFWRWHINFCPGFKAYFTHQDKETKAALRERYQFEKYQ